MGTRGSGSVLLAGLDTGRLPWELSRLGPSFDILQGRAAAHALLDRLRSDVSASLAVLGQWLPDLTLAETIRRIRTDPELRHVSVIAITRDTESRVAGANVVLPLSADGSTIERWVSKLRSVPPRVKLSAQVRGRTVAHKEPFFGFVRNISTAGMRVFSPDEVSTGAELDVWLELASSDPFPALARVVRSDVGPMPLPHAYGIEFVYLPQSTEDAVWRAIEGGRPNRPTVDTLQAAAWTYDVINPVRRGERWEAEVWRSGPEQRGERFFSVAGASSRDALREAREVLLAWALVRTGSCVMAREAPEPMLSAVVGHS
jgi:hypothetical protein